ncbi:MAG: decarboxylating NADP(+)-dependent phosphogluconate dehydrogenase [Verrucomicrobia bacterium]|nr:decarboxylating NADP(+)-dependent phosphogluconate dehydrogenase [Verrucomicrobiota bacterium]MBV9299616.1 decarboxylating NADP(+)-dependent phosphogluconate dehydrogenase [Verrucomicrobiota bacterium]MBV9643917.1 decarboxylating NADP(+)-dependent phosphogluconate dehydrogenase [Verrucomicrobiota bacterium]
MNPSDIGLIGLAVMGENLVLNMESKGFSVSVYNRTTEVTEKFAAKRGAGKRISPTRSIEEFVESLGKPRKMMIMVKAGSAVDAVIDQLLPHLDKGDVVIDGGNSLYTDTERREEALSAKGLNFMGIGVSGGEEGALKGPSLMPGGTKEAWEIVSPIFRKIAAQVDGEPCCRYMGSGGAGHYVKMVHNGIEYGDMQLICEAYAILHDVLGLGADELHEVFDTWNKGDLDSFLIEITANIFRRKDSETDKPLVDVILDKAGQKGTGKWTLLSAIEQGVVVSTINAAVEARVLSSMKEQRVRASKILPAPSPFKYDGDRQKLIDAVRDALYASKIMSYAQGFTLFAAASKQFNWNLNFGDIATIWRGGCIIRAKFLNRIKEAFDRNPQMENLMLDPFFSAILKETQANWRHAISIAIQAGVAAPAFGASLAYFDSYRQERLPANLLQAQRDYFGAHTYERVDKPGVFHTEWLQ